MIDQVPEGWELKPRHFYARISEDIYGNFCPLLHRLRKTMSSIRFSAYTREKVPSERTIRIATQWFENHKCSGPKCNWDSISTWEDLTEENE